MTTMTVQSSFVIDLSDNAHLRARPSNDRPRYLDEHNRRSKHTKLGSGVFGRENKNKKIIILDRRSLRVRSSFQSRTVYRTAVAESRTRLRDGEIVVQGAGRGEDSKSSRGKNKNNKPRWGTGDARDRHAETGTRPILGAGTGLAHYNGARRGSTRGYKREFYFAKRARLTNRTKPPSRARAHADTYEYTSTHKHRLVKPTL